MYKFIESIICVMSPSSDITAEAREKLSHKEDRFIELTDELKVVDARIGTLHNNQQELRMMLKDYKQRNPRGVEDARTLRSFLAGKRTQNAWLQTHIDDFFPRAELRGKKSPRRSRRTPKKYEWFLWWNDRRRSFAV